MNSSPTIIIFGASGDLTNRKLIPALYSAYRKKRLPEGTRIVGFARRPWSDDDFRNLLLESTREFRSDFQPKVWAKLAPMISYFQGDLDKVDSYKKLQKYIKSNKGY